MFIFSDRETTASRKQTTLIEKLNTIERVVSPEGSSATYVRWGRSSCPDNGTELVYEGYAGGSHYTHAGGAANYLCLPKDPTWSHYKDGHDGGHLIYGTEYEFGSRAREYFDKDLHNQDVPCAVCKTKRSNVLMIPAHNQCYDGWTMEYKGYLVAGHHSQASATEFICLDGEAGIVEVGATDQNGKLMYQVEASCGSLKCPPYVEGRELACVVCSV